MLKSLRRTALAGLLALPTFASAASNAQPNVVLDWTDAALAGIRDSNMGAPVVARALATVETCMYDAWAAYDDKAVGTELRDALRRPAVERTYANKQKAVSFAAFQALQDILPVDTNARYRPLMQKLRYNAENRSRDIETPEGIAHVACGAVLEMRHHDQSNQLGDLAPGAYSDWTRYTPLNLPLYVNGGAASVTNVEHWQPLTYVDEAGNLETQRFVGAQWCYVTPFALKNGDQFRSLVQRYGPASKDSAQFRKQAEELISLSAGLTNRQKMIAECWEDGPHSEQPPGHWGRFAEYVSLRDKHSLDDDVKLFFALSNAMLDAGIAAWDAKRAFDSVRPITAIRVLFKGQSIRAWGGPGRARWRWMVRAGCLISPRPGPLPRFRSLSPATAPTAPQPLKYCCSRPEAIALKIQ